MSSEAHFTVLPLMAEILDGVDIVDICWLLIGWVKLRSLHFLADPSVPKPAAHISPAAVAKPPENLDELWTFQISKECKKTSGIF